MGAPEVVLVRLRYYYLNDSLTSDSFDLVARYYNLDRELLLAGQRLRFSQFKTAHVEKSIKTAAELVETLHENRLYKYFRTTPWKKNFLF